MGHRQAGNRPYGRRLLLRLRLGTKPLGLFNRPLGRPQSHPHRHRHYGFLFLPLRGCRQLQPSPGHPYLDGFCRRRHLYPLHGDFDPLVLEKRAWSDAEPLLRLGCRHGRSMVLSADAADLLIHGWRQYHFWPAILARLHPADDLCGRFDCPHQLLGHPLGPIGARPAFGTGKRG